MEKRGYLKIIITALVPKTAGCHGKSGALVRTAEILKRISRLTEAEIVLVASDEFYADYFREKGIAFDFRRVKSNLRFKSSVGLCLKSLLIIAKAFFTLKLDFLKNIRGKTVVYSSSDLFWETIPAWLLRAKGANIEWIQVIHHIYPDWRKRPGGKAANFFGYHLQKFSFRLARKNADKIIVLNSIVKNALVRTGFSEENIFVSSNGIDVEYFKNIPKADKAYEGVFLGRLNYSKGLEDLVEIWKAVSEKKPEAKLAIVGGGNEETTNFLRKKICERRLRGRVDLLGFLEDNRAYSILKSGKVFLFPSREEGWGMAVAEAMACELPVVSWDLPVFKEIFGSYTFQIEEGNINLFSQKIIEFLNDNSLREAIGKSGKEFIRKYSWDGVAERELELIKKRIC